MSQSYSKLKDEIEFFIFEIDQLDAEYEIRQELGKLVEFLAGAFGQTDQTDFFFNALSEKKVYVAKNKIVSRLRGLMARENFGAPSLEGEISYENKNYLKKEIPPKNKKVFLVHGHDEAARESVARFLEKLGLHPIVLHEQANASKTIIEKLEENANVLFAVILLTPDDVGASKNNQNNLSLRARQNVLIELGYFIGLLGRSKICALRVGDTEVPSDFSGVVYTLMDKDGAWKMKLAQELIHANYEIKLEALVS